MEINLLSQTGAITPGADLWILCPKEHSTWAQYLDWYLNFQIARAVHFRQSPPAPELISLATHFEIPMPTVKVSTTAPILINSQHYLPNKTTLILPVMGSAEEWVDDSISLWQNLGHPSARIFLPQQVSPELLTAKWQDLPGLPLTVVPPSLDKIAL